MLAELSEFWHSLLDTVRIADLVDVLLIAVCIYFVLLWLRLRASRAVVVGLSLLVLLYVTARQMDMVLASWLFQVGLTALFVGLVLVFQNDIRSLFERLARMTGIVQRHTSVSASAAEILAHSLGALAKQRIGALVVLPGRDPLDQYTHGGIRLGGLLSEALLDSIFDPSSNGHDGAMIVNEQFVLRFGVHLPLSENLEELGDHGTRHAAGLGLSERTDALVLIVSEEHGSISIAQEGRLVKVPDDAALLARIQAFALRTAKEDRLQRSRLARGGAWLHQAITRHWLLKLSALLLAAGIWLVVAFRVVPVVRQLSVPVQFTNLPADAQVTDVYPETITLTLSGPEHRFNLLDVAQLQVSIDLDGLRPGRHLKTFEEFQLDLPPGKVTVSDFSPDGVSFTLVEQPTPAPPAE